jgi:hypothetical protein
MAKRVIALWPHAGTLIAVDLFPGLIAFLALIGIWLGRLEAWS